MPTARADDALYEPLGEGRYRATESTVGPWSDKAQHLGAVSALLVREVERTQPRPELDIRRVCVDVLGPVPVDEVAVRAEVSRPGRSVELVTAEISAGGRVAATARAWRMLRSDTADVADSADSVLPPPETCAAMPVPAGWRGGYASSLEWRLAENTAESGRALVWSRLRTPVVSDEDPSTLQSLFAVTDCAGGISSSLSFERWAFANTDLTVHLNREPAGEWIGLNARMSLGPDGAGIAHSTVHDASGPVARSAQALLLTRL